MINWFGNLPLVEKIGWSLLGLVLIGFFLAVFFFGFRRLVSWQTLKNIKDDKDRISLKIEIIKTVASILGGMFFILTIVVAFWNYKVTQEKHITDLFTKAIEQLGSKQLEVKLGGIYALERIARDSEKDHWTIMEVLTAYIRENTPWPPKKQTIFRSEENEKSPETWSPKPHVPMPWPPPSIHKPTVDVQAILTVISRRKRMFGQGEDKRLDLRQTDLRGADLIGAHLEGANFTGAHLEGARLRNAKLANAILDRAHLKSASLVDTHLDGATLYGANLEGAFLVDVRMQRAFLNGAELKGVILHGGHLDKAVLIWANLENSKFIGSHLEGAEFDNANLKGADLSSAKGLTERQLRFVNYDENTKLPNYLKHLEKTAGSKPKKE